MIDINNPIVISSNKYEAGPSILLFEDNYKEFKENPYYLY